MRNVLPSLLLLALASAVSVQAQPQNVPTDIDERIIDRLEQLAGGPHAGARATHAKGLLIEGVFEALPAAAGVSRAAHFRAGSSAVLVRFSNNGGLPTIADTDPHGQPLGVALRFALPDGDATDLLMLSSHTFPTRNRSDFLALLDAAAASGPGVPHPTPVEQYIGSHPETARFFQELPSPPRHYGTAQYFSVAAFKFTNAQGQSRFGRYRLVPLAGVEVVPPGDAASRGPNYLSQALQTALASGPVRYRLLLQLAQEGDTVNDGSVQWPETRPMLELGILSLTRVFPDGAARQKRLAYNPLRLTDGIDDAGDPMLKERSVNYPVSVSRRIASGE